MARTIKEIIGNEELEVFLQKGYYDPAYWIEKVSGLKLANFHKEWINLISNNRFLNITSFRGSCKSHLFAIWYPLWTVWYKRSKNILVVSRDLKQATKIMDDLTSTIIDNELLNSLMPNDRKLTWSKSEINTTTKCKVFTRALTDSILGVRTDYVLVDEAGSFNNDQIELYRRAIEPTVDLRKGKIVVIGTPRHLADLLSILKQNKAYISKVYKILENGKSIWPEVYSDEDCKKIRERIGESAWQSEYLCNASAEAEGAIFPGELIGKCLDFTRKFSTFDEGGIKILAADFAIAKGPTADFDAYTVVEKVAGVTVLKHGERHKGLSIAGKAMRLKELYDLYKCESIYVDPSNVGEAVMEEIRNMGLPIYPVEMHSAARNHLLLNMLRMMENNQLVIPRDLEDTATYTYTQNLISELLGFQQVKSKATDTLQIRSRAIHDDCAISLAIACKGIANKKECLDIIGF